MIMQIKTISGDLKSQTTGNMFRVVELVNGQKLYAWKDTVKQSLMQLQPGMQADFRLKGEGGQYPSIEDVVPVYQQGNAPAAQTGVVTPGSPPNEWQGQTQQLAQNVIDPNATAAVNQPPVNPQAPPPPPMVEDPKIAAERIKQESIERQCALKEAVNAVTGFQATLWNENPTSPAIQETILQFQQVFLQIIKGKIGGGK